MKSPALLKAVLILSGLVALSIGAAVTFVPSAFYGTYGISLPADIGWTNEIRAFGGGLLMSGVLIVSGAFIPRMTFTSLILAACLYLGYGTARALSLVVDGAPHSAFIQVAGLELVIGGICLLFALRSAPCAGGHRAGTRPEGG